MSNSVFNKHKTSTVYCVIDRIKCRQNETKIKSIGFIRFWKCFDIGSCNGLMPSSMVFLFIFFRFLLFSHEHLIHWLLIYILLFVCAPYQSCWLSLLAERVFDSHLDSNKVTTRVTGECHLKHDNIVVSYYRSLITVTFVRNHQIFPAFSRPIINKPDIHESFLSDIQASQVWFQEVSTSLLAS